MRVRSRARDAWRDGAPSDALRWLASPVTVLCLVVLALNDQWLKQAWPGLVTGKLSDVVGLVVAPPLLAVVLTLVRSSWPAAVALGATAVGFTLTKATTTGAAVASEVWGWAGTPTYIRADPTDLLALPALGVAAWGWVAVRRAPERDRRSRVGASVGVLVLPFGVAVTSATSCAPFQVVSSVYVVTGDLAGGPPGRERVLVLDVPRVVVRAPGLLQGLSTDELPRLGVPRPRDVDTCDPADPQRCWRAGEDDRPVVEGTSDGGATWTREFEITEGQLDALREELGEKCGSGPEFAPLDLAVLGTPAGPVVAMTAQEAGLLLRTPDDGWRALLPSDVHDLASEAPEGSGRGRLVVEDVVDG